MSNWEEFLRTIEKVKKSEYFNTEECETKKLEICTHYWENGKLLSNVETEEIETGEMETEEMEEVEILAYYQEESLEQHGKFLSLVPVKDYPQVAFDVLQAFHHYNLSKSEEKYRFESRKLKAQERNAVQKDIKLAKEYWATLHPGELSRMIALRICELKTYLKRREEEKPGFIEIHEYRLIKPRRYDKYRLPDMYTKKNIRAVLSSIAKRYDLKGYTKDIKNIADSH